MPGSFDPAAIRDDPRDHAANWSRSSSVNLNFRNRHQEYSLDLDLGACGS